MSTRNYVQLPQLGYVQHLAAAVDVGVNLAPPAGAVYAVVIPEAQAVRWRDDGQNPSATVGMPLAVGQALQVDGKLLSQYKFISQTAGAILNVSYYGFPL